MNQSDQRPQHHFSASIPLLCCGLLLCGLLAACAQSTSKAPPRAKPLALRCTLAVPTGAETEIITLQSTTLTCTVTNASPSAVSFTLHYKIADWNGAHNRFDLICSGPIEHGAGACHRAFAVPYPFAPDESWVTGLLLPMQQQLGPIHAVPLTPATHL
jgi:hypothetical protein